MDDDALVTLTVRKKHLWAILGALPSLAGLGGYIGSGDTSEAIQRAQAQLRVERVHQMCTAAGYVNGLADAESGPPSLVIRESGTESVAR